jgi:1-deoxy-D-xylulose-5-phosphate synthase
MALSDIRQPADLRKLGYPDVYELAGEIRDFVVQAVAENAGHLGSNLGVVELTLALHRVFDSPTDAILWDTGHQAYVHKIVTGRQAGFEHLRQANGLSGYPNREESDHDLIENSHASTVLSYAYGLAIARDAGTDPHRHIVAVIGDGAMTGGMAYEALNNLGTHYSGVGRLLEAVAPAEDAVTIYRALAADNPAYRPDLAMALNNLGNSYSGVGRDAEAVARARAGTPK